MGRTKLLFNQILEEESQREREEGRDILREIYFQSSSQILKDVFKSFEDILKSYEVTKSRMVVDNKNQTDGDIN
tara:strand:- start:18981 stop:19202 length:222 start_codon:yes stop_codon:yes gene_type:complete